MSSLDELISEALRQAGDDTPVRERASVGGGSISQAMRVRTDRRAYLLKIGGRGLPGFFAAEARGLRQLAAAGAVRVPAVLAPVMFTRAARNLLVADRAPDSL